ncbi:hypothetical protein [Nostoc sp.]
MSNSILDFGLTIAQRKANSTRGCANGMATLRDAVRVRLERVCKLLLD